MQFVSEWRRRGHFMRNGNRFVFMRQKWRVSSQEDIGPARPPARARLHAAAMEVGSGSTG